ncbi:MAG: tetratricopeptide repeat protein, partial [Mesorhizobium sp.]
SDSTAHNCFGDLMGCLGDLEAAERAHRRAFECGSNHADTLALLAGSKALVAGDPAEAIPLIERAMRLNPLAPPWYFGMQGRVLFTAGRYRDAIAALRRSTPDSPHTLIFLMLAHAREGEGAEAAAIASRLRTEFPGFSVDGFIAGYPVTNPDAVRAIRDAAKLVAIR